MKLEDQVCSLELAKKLKELGVKQEAMFQWLWGREEGDEPDDDTANRWVLDRRDLQWEMFLAKATAAAFTVGELGAMLPYHWLYSEVKTIYPTGVRVGTDLGYLRKLKGERYRYDPFNIEDATTEADARALLLIHLLENKLMEAKQ